MNINKLQDLNFCALRGLREPNNEKVFRQLASNFDSIFVNGADKAFQMINDMSGNEDVFIKFEEVKYKNINNKTEKDTNILILDQNGDEICRQCIFSSRPIMTKYKIEERFRNLTRLFRDNFNPDMSLKGRIDTVINKFA